MAGFQPTTKRRILPMTRCKKCGRKLSQFNSTLWKDYCDLCVDEILIKRRKYHEKSRL
jgi:rRNA maturation endonuclease Nob1